MINATSEHGKRFGISARLLSKNKRRRAGDNTPIDHAVLLSSVKEAHFATVIDLWQVAAVYAFVDNSAPFEEEKYDCLLQRLQDLGFKLDQLLLVPALG